MSLDYLVYGSAASRALASGDLENILSSAQRNNEEHNLTGLLLYAEGNFIQVLEGEKDPLTKTYADIVGDPRHKDINLFFYGPAEQRYFKGWSMGYRCVERRDLPRGLVNLCADTIRGVEDGTEIVTSLFRQFYTSACRFEPV